jgi:hypothetical protein
MENHQRTPRFSLAHAGSCRMTNLRRHFSRSAMEASFSRMDGWEKRSIRLEAGDHARFSYDSRITGGSLFVDLIAPDGTTVVRWGNQPSVTTEFTAHHPGKYTVLVTADEAAGSYRLELLGE